MAASPLAVKRLQKWIWLLIYAGMALLALGLAIRPTDAAFGWGVAVPGIALITAGVVLIWVRSRMPSTEENP